MLMTSCGKCGCEFRSAGSEDWQVEGKQLPRDGDDDDDVWSLDTEICCFPEPVRASRNTHDSHRASHKDTPDLFIHGWSSSLLARSHQRDRQTFNGGRSKRTESRKRMEIRIRIRIRTMMVMGFWFVETMIDILSVALLEIASSSSDDDVSPTSLDPHFLLSSC